MSAQTPQSGDSFSYFAEWGTSGLGDLSGPPAVSDLVAAITPQLANFGIIVETNDSSGILTSILTLGIVEPTNVTLGCALTTDAPDWNTVKITIDGAISDYLGSTANLTSSEIATINGAIATGAVAPPTTPSVVGSLLGTTPGGSATWLLVGAVVLLVIGLFYFFPEHGKRAIGTLA